VLQGDNDPRVPKEEAQQVVDILCVANCNFVFYRTCNNVTSAHCMLFIVKALLILAKQCVQER